MASAADGDRSARIRGLRDCHDLLRLSPIFSCSGAWTATKTEQHWLRPTRPSPQCSFRLDGGESMGEATHRIKSVVSHLDEIVPALAVIVARAAST